MKWSLLLSEDSSALGFEPFSATRPAGELLFGALLLRERVERATGIQVAGYLRPGWEGFTIEGIPPVMELPDAAGPGGLIILSTRYVPPLATGRDERFTLPASAPEGPTRLYASGSPVGWLIPPGGELPPATEQEGQKPDTEPELRLDLPGTVLDTLWELLERNQDQLEEDLATLYPDGTGNGVSPFQAPSSVSVLGEHSVSVSEGVVIDPGVILDARLGPIHLERGVRVRPFTHLGGPAFVGERSTLLGGSFDSFSCGPVCNLRGEISASVLLGYTNKAHDGYLGHSLVGRWVNLGAMTTNSDLKNNYGSVRVMTAEGETDTGLVKLGVFLGDHVKTGIGTLLGAGTIVGVGTNLFGGGPVPKRVPPFKWGNGQELVPYRLEAFLKTAERAMQRRGVPLTPQERSLMSRIWREVNGGAEPEGVG